MTHNPHRHYVVLPVLLLLTVCSTIVGTYSGSTTMPAEMKGNPYIALPSGGSAEVSLGGRFEADDAGGELIAGTVLLQSLAPVVVRAGDLHMTFLGGAAFLSRDDDSVTVAAVSTPVLVQDGETFLAVPAGMQWKTGAKRLSVISEGIATWITVRNLSSLPQRFLNEQRRRAAEMPSDILLPEPVAGPLPVRSATALDAARLPQAIARSEEDWREMVLGMLRYHIEQEDTESVQQLLLHADLADVWKTRRAHTVIAILLLGTPQPVSLQQLLLPVLSTNPGVLLLCSLHAHVSSVCWTLPPDSLGTERSAARAFAFPFTDTGTDAHRGLMWQRWGEGLSTLLQSEKYAPEALRSVIGLLGPLALAREEQGYPERSRLLAQVLLENAKRMQGEFDPETLRILDQLRRFDSVDIRVQAGVVSLSRPQTGSPSPKNSEEFDQAGVRQKAQDLLHRAGAIISLETRIIPQSAEEVRMEDIVFGGTDRDRTVSFVLRLDRSEVRQIVEGTEEYPYAMPWEDFVRWMRR